MFCSFMIDRSGPHDVFFNVYYQNQLETFKNKTLVWIYWAIFTYLDFTLLKSLKI